MRRKRLLIVAATVGVLIGLPIAWYLSSPLFINRTVDEAFPVARAAPRPADAPGMPSNATARPTSVQPTVMAQPTEAMVDATATLAPSDEPTPTPAPTASPSPTAPPVPTEEPAPTAAAPATVSPEPVVLKSGQFHPVEHRGAGAATIYQLVDGTRVLRFEDFDVLNGPDLYVYLSRAEDADDEAPILESGFVSLGRLKGNQGNQNYELPADLDPGEFHSVSIWCRQFSVNFATAPLR